jgi:hypothetical protein
LGYDLRSIREDIPGLFPYLSSYWFDYGFPDAVPFLVQAERTAVELLDIPTTKADSLAQGTGVFFTRITPHTDSLQFPNQSPTTIRRNT